MKKIKLDESNKIKAPYTVPDDYFDTLSDRIRERIHTPVRTESVTVVRWQWALAPALLVILALFFWLYPLQDSQDVSQMLAEVSDTEIYAYLEQTGGLSEHELAGMLSEEEVILDEEVILEEMELDTEEMDDILLQYDLEDEMM